MGRVSLDHQGDYLFVVTAIFPSQYKGFCKLDLAHRIKRGDMVGKLEHAGNPMLPVSGVACEACTRDLPRAPRE